MPSRYLFHYAQVHNEFRLPELQSIAELYGIPYTLPQNPEDRDSTRPFMIVELDEEEHARMLARRCILIKAVYEYYGHGSTYDELHEVNRKNESLWARYVQDTSFRFLVTSSKHKIPQSRQREVIENFAYMGFLGKIDMKSPEIILTCFEEYEERHGTTRVKHEGDGEFRQVFFGRLIEEGSARQLVGKFDVKKRSYYGNTSMEAEISLLMANQTLASPGKLIYDPFMGTGSMAYPTGYFGALVFGSDIDGRQMRGKQKTPGVIRAATQYGIASRIVDLATFDVTHNPWRCGELFDSIVTDPPYGVRAGAKRLGRKRELSERQKELCLQHSLAPRPDDQPYIPPTKPYELSHLATDLVLLARYLLKPGGRLVFFLPTVTDEYEEVDIHTMMCEGMELVANSLQDFGSWGRRLVTIRKVTKERYPPPTFDPMLREANEETHIPAHKDFREKYFQGFKSKADETKG
ncbi:tRNA (guanine(10)-N2)-methyltransferase [Psilocybe cubensis]|uniref:tRNA (Guanine(10)-N2)-methyltransferase n=2 Tax=Psilocybe cubensis TaxID=181762 RepID=A0ACB8HBF3_PSICU|nr:tRNA (guanine(10)-N2)-methyltransferase [Psilocybe cubensis]KAH9484987.1 tRNA (guanine(10)-N2)-methyltransferase [Psilocybe cubensis]